MDSPILISNLKFMQILKARNHAFFNIAEEVYRRAEIQLNSRIPALFPEYTQHDIHHAIRIIETIEGLVNDIDALNDFEILLIVASCLLHDTGMGVDSNTIAKIRTNSSGLTDIKFEAMVEKFSGDEQLALQELIRTIHGDLSANVIAEYYRDLFVFKEVGNLTFYEDIILICKSHTKDHIWVDANLKKSLVKDRYEYNPHYLSILLRLGDILDFDGRRTPLLLYNIIRPSGLSDKEWTQHFVVSNVDKIKLDRETNLKKVVIHGKCTDVDLHRKFLSYVDWINNELEYAVEATTLMPSKFRLFFKTKVELNVESVGYTISNYRLNIDFRSITNLLMGEKIYGERSLGIRELVQNSIDACKVRMEKEEQTFKFGDEPYVPVIKIIIDETGTSVIIKDNGCGMDEEIIKKYFLNIGKSYYTSDDYLLRKHQYKPIGNYGIGFLSCFMLSDKVLVRTSKPNDRQRFDLVLEKGSEYISFTQVEDATFSGTEVQINHESFSKVLEDEKTDIEAFLHKYFVNEIIKISIIDRMVESEKEVKNILNSLSVSGNNEYLVDFSAELKDCHACSIVKQKNSFVYQLSDISKIKKLVYFYDGIFHLDSDLPISEFVNGELFEYLNIPVYEEGMKSDFETAYRLLGDLDDVIDKVEPDFWYSLIIKKEDQLFVIEKEIYGKNDKTIINDIDEDFFLEFIDKEDCFIPKVFSMEDKLFGNSSKTIYLSYSEDIIYSNYSYLKNPPRIKVFLRDILVRNHTFKIPALPSIFEIEKISLNILNQKLIPDVSRNKFDDKTADMINYSVSKALLKSATNNASFKGDETELLKEFIAAKYNEGSILN